MPTRKDLVRRKEKKSYTLSSHSVAFLEAVRKETKARSASMALELLIRDAERLRRHKVIDERIEAYYTDLSAEEARELQQWGEFAATQHSEREPS